MPARNGAGRRAAAAVVAVVGLALTGFGSAHLASDLLAAAYDPVLRDLGRRQIVLAPALRDAIDSRRLALSVGGGGAREGELGALYLAWSRRGAAGSEQRLHYRALAEASLRAALAASPAQPYAWLHLAHVVHERGAAAAAFTPLLAMAARTAPFEPPLVRARVALGLAAWPRLDPDGRALVAGDVRRLAGAAPATLAEIARSRLALVPVRGILRDHPAMKAAFERAYLSLR